MQSDRATANSKRRVAKSRTASDVDGNDEPKASRVGDGSAPFEGDEDMEDDREVPEDEDEPSPGTACTSLELTAHEPSRQPAQTGPPGIV